MAIVLSQSETTSPIRTTSSASTKMEDEAGVSLAERSGTPIHNTSRKKFSSKEGEIGYMRADSFVAVTNFTVECIGYVKNDANSTTAEGYVLGIIQKKYVQSDSDQDKSTPKR